MIRKLLREFYLLPRGEQRAMILLSLLVFLTLCFRIAAGLLPSREPAGLQQFQEEARVIIASLEKADSLKMLTMKSSWQKRDGAIPSATYSYHANHHTPTVYINEADSADLLPLPGIGPVFAGRIVKYRRLLGGYCRLEQLSEIYGMRQETLDLVAQFLVLDTIGLEKLKVNRCGFRDLLRHPYLEYEDVKALLNYRDFEGKIGSLGEIRLNGLLEDSTLVRVGPYLDFTK